MGGFPQLLFNLLPAAPEIAALLGKFAGKRNETIHRFSKRQS